MLRGEVTPLVTKENPKPNSSTRQSSWRVRLCLALGVILVVALVVGGSIGLSLLIRNGDALQLEQSQHLVVSPLLYPQAGDANIVSIAVTNPSGTNTILNVHIDSQF